MLASVAEIVFRQSDSGFDEFVASGLDETFEAVKSRRTTNPQARLEGYAFQKLFLDMLTDERVGLVVGKDFRYEQFFDKQKCEALGHSPACKMDFIFPNFIVDTKRSITATSKINHQTSRYLDHTDHLIRVTLNQKYRTVLENNKQLTDMTVYEFIERSEDLLGVAIPYLWKTLFLEYSRDAANSIEDAWGK